MCYYYDTAVVYSANVSKKTKRPSKCPGHRYFFTDTVEIVLDMLFRFNTSADSKRQKKHKPFPWGKMSAFH